MENGYTGTEEEWLASLKGEKGDTGETGADGKDGAAGADGADGKSAYEIAVESGYSGTEVEWLASLKGEKGDTGEQGEKGEKGDTGATGADGKDGAAGEDGFSPTASVSKADGVATITVTDKDGTTTASVSDGETPDISKVENTVEALAAGLADSDWVQITDFVGGNNIDTEKSKVYYRKIGTMVNLLGVIYFTAATATTVLVDLPSAIRPYSSLISTEIPASVICSDSANCCIYMNQLHATAGISSTLRFNITYMTNDTPADASSLLAALADLVEVE